MVILAVGFGVIRAAYYVLCVEMCLKVVCVDLCMVWVSGTVWGEATCMMVYGMGCVPDGAIWVRTVCVGSIFVLSVCGNACESMCDR